MNTEGGCGCCAGLVRQTPQSLTNRPGLSEIAFRTGTWARFRASMHAGLTRGDRPALAGLRTRDPSDLSMALIDAWAVAADVLTFYTERAANENYLGTATERRSVAGLVGLIGYRLGAGVAAQADLAFTVDTSPGSPPAVPIPVGAKAQTLPGPGEVPQTFETVEGVTALAAWNSLPVRLTEPRVPGDADRSVLLAGTTTGLVRGDTIALIGAAADATSGFATARVSAVEVDPQRRVTRVHFGAPHGSLGAVDDVACYAMRSRAALFGFNAASPTLFMPVVKTALEGQLLADEWDFKPLSAEAVDLDGIHDGVVEGSPVILTNGATEGGDGISGAGTVLAHVSALREVARTEYGISAKVTRLALDVTAEELEPFGDGNTRATVLLLRAEPLPLADVPITTPVFGSVVEMDAGLEVPEVLPRPILLRGLRARAGTTSAAEAQLIRDDGTTSPTTGAALVVLSIEVDEADPDFRHLRMVDIDGVPGTLAVAADDLVFTEPLPDDPLVGERALVTLIDGAVVTLAAPLATVFDRASLEIRGNIATGTHGESVHDEVLGSGDAAKANQRFTLRGRPLTHTQAATPTGGESTLRVFVNDIEWSEVANLYGRGPGDRVFATATTDEGGTVVLFGDGVSGARPPTGRDNIVARYRVGTGLGGSARAEQLSLLMTRPLGVKGVVNPLAAAGAQDPEVAEDASDNAPRSVLTLDRIVSLSDFADFARGIGGIGKAVAAPTWDGQVRGVAVSVAGVGGAPIDPQGQLMKNLRDAVAQACNPRVPVLLLPAEVGPVTLETQLVLLPGFQPDPVLDEARAALCDHFSFARRDFGQPIALSEVDLVLHGVRGVAAVFVTRLHRAGEPGLRRQLLVARALLPGAPPPSEGAEILVIDPDTLLLEVAP